MLAKRKKGVMGIGTLIIFISVILVAAVAAGVIISTAGLLQQKSLIVGEEARKRLVNQLEIISVVVGGNSTAEKLNNFEVIARLGPGSNPIQLRTLGITLLTDEFDSSMVLQRYSMDNTTYNVLPPDGASSEPYSLVAQPAGTSIVIDDRDGDGVNDRMWITNDTETHKVLVTISNNNDPINATADLGLNFSATTTKFIDAEALIEDVEGIGYGFVLVNGYVNSSNISTEWANLTIQNEINECSPTQVERELKFCYSTKLGNTDTVLDAGEVVQFEFRMKEANRLDTNQRFELTFYPDKGSLTRINRRTPDVITTSKVFLFP